MLVCLGMPTAVWRECDVCATAKASDGMLLSRVPIPGCCSPLPLGPTSAFQEIGLGLLPTSASGRATGTQPTSVTALGGPAVSIQLLQGPRGAGGPWPDGICPGPAQRSAARPRGAQLHLELGCSQPSALRAAWNQRRAAVAGWGRMQARRIGLAIGRASPPERPLPGCSLPIHRLRAACGSCMLRYQARQLRWRKRRVAAASSGLVCARPTLLGASFACDFDPRVPDAAQVHRRDAACRKLCQMREFNADICAKL